ncbi:MAG: DEAD/DEAH box helicase, partial [Haloferacaceae archaeon]
PGDLVRAGAAELERAGLAAGVAERVVEAAADLPAPRISWDPPASVGRGESEMCEVRVENAGGGGRLGVRVTVEGREMSTGSSYLRAGEATTLPVGVFGAADADELTYRVEVVTPDLPLPPVVDERTVTVA